jgi:hypothetical protein
MRWVDTLIACRRWEMVINAGVAAGGVALNIYEAGGITPYLKKLKNPVHAALFLLDLLTIKGAFKADKVGRMIEENRILAQELERLYAEQKGLKGAAKTIDSGQEARQLDDRALGEATATADKSLPEAAGVPRDPPVSTVESARPTLSDRATALVQKQLPRESMEDARFWTKKPANDNERIVQQADDLGLGPGKKGRPKEGPHPSTPIDIPRRDPIVEFEPRSGGGPRPKPKKAQSTDELPPVADLRAVRKEREAQRARQEKEAAAQPQVQEEVAEAIPASMGDRARMGRRLTGPMSKKGKGSSTSTPVSTSREVRDALAVLEDAAKADLEQRRFERLLSLLRPFRKGGRKAAKAYRYDKGATSQAEKEMVDCPPELIEEVAIARATEELDIARRGEDFPERAFKSNFAAFEVTIDGKRFVVVARNEEEGRHSEQWIVQFLTQRVGPLSEPKNLARVKVHNVFTERAPCSGRCENVLKDWFEDANIFFVTGKQGQRSEAADKTIKRYWMGTEPSGQGGGLPAPVS